MNLPTDQDGLFELLGALCSGTITPAEHERLEVRLAADRSARQLYFDYIDLHLHLRQWQRAEGGKKDECGMMNDELSADATCGGIHHSSFLIPHSDLSPLIPPIIIDTSPAPVSALRDWLFSYGTSAVIMGIALLTAGLWTVSQYQGMVRHVAHAPLPAEPRPEPVGRITGMADCVWSDADDAPRGLAVALGGKYALASGLLEISYHSGAKVILQGPCTYEVESARGGYLSLGKLTARVDGAKPQAAGPESRTSNPQFVVKTPTAVVTDLGTEFGVEVSKEGNTTSHVFRGSVQVQLATGSNSEGERHAVVLRENESARVEKADGGPRLVRSTTPGVAASFRRSLAELPKRLDLLDIVAGGNGTGKHRGRGLDPTTGMEDPLMVTDWRGGDGHYARVGWNKLIDGVFVPNGGGPVQVDSAGHKFGGFPPTEGRTWGSICSRGADVTPRDHAREPLNWLYSMGRGGQFMPEGRGLLALNSNSGITLDLEAMRTMYAGTRPVRFRATAGMADSRRVDPDVPAGLADIWILVDGRLKWNREKLRPEDGVLRVDIELGPSDRFLTLATTDGGNGIDCDWVVYGDPVLEMAAEPANPPGKEK